MGRRAEGTGGHRGTMIELREVAGPEVGPWLTEVARLRMTVFREYPYLYDGDLDYEREYLSTYARSPESLFVLAIDAARVVGASTAVPLAHEVDAFRKPFRDAGIAESEVFYFGESVLLREYRGHGLGGRFFDAREGRAKALGRFRWTAFCAVVRADGDPRRPAGHRGNETLWQRRGYTRRDGMRARLEWKETGADAPVMHDLAFWLRPL
jgi:GNAT superfamily N-acetyltransferase